MKSGPIALLFGTFSATASSANVIGSFKGLLVSLMASSIRFSRDDSSGSWFTRECGACAVKRSMRSLAILTSFSERLVFSTEGMFVHALKLEVLLPSRLSEAPNSFIVFGLVQVFN